MTIRLALLSFALVFPAMPALADDTVTSGGVPMRALAPADEYFGHARLSVLGIANTIRDAGARLDEGAAPATIVDGPLFFAGDAIRDWERQFPMDPWIARDLFGLEVAYLRAHTARAIVLARKTTAWLMHDYPDAHEAEDGRLALADATGNDPGTDNPADAWARFAALRAPLPPQ